MAPKTQNRSTTPREEWPGRPIGPEDIEAACGHPDDVFSMDQRMAAWRLADAWHWQRWEAGSRARVRWKVEMAVGDMGAGKSTYMVLTALKAYMYGIPVFHNGSLLFGNLVMDDEIWALVMHAPINCVIALDEIHTLNAKGAAEGARNQRLQNETLTGLRKKKCRLVMGTAGDHQVGRTLREACEDVVFPQRLAALPGSRRDFDAAAFERRSLGLKNQYAPGGHAHLFQMGVHRISDYPWRPDGMAEEYGINPKRGPMGQRPHKFYRIPPRQVRFAMMLNDSFAPVRAGVGMTADRDAIMEAHREYLRGGDSEVIPVGQRIAFALYEAFDTELLTPSGYMRVGVLRETLRKTQWMPRALKARGMSQHIEATLGVSPNRQNGYRLLDLRAALESAVERVN